MPGDIVFIVGGTLPILYLCTLGILHMRKGPKAEDSEETLFTEVTVAGGR